MVESPPANAGDMGSDPGPGGSHMPRSSWARAPRPLGLRSRAHEPRLLSLSATTTEVVACLVVKPACLEPVLSNERGHRNEKPALPATKKKARAQQQRPNAANI